MAKTRKQRGSGVLTSQQWFNPQVLPPSTLWPTTLTTAPTTTMVRPVLPATFQSGGKARTTQRMTKKRGGFYPSVMGSFLANAQAAVVPLTFYALYHTLVPKKNSTTGGKTRRNRGRK